MRKLRFKAVVTATSRKPVEVKVPATKNIGILRMQSLQQEGNGKISVERYL